VSLTLLLDLDDTLLHTNMETFLPAYLEAWSSFISPYADPQKFVKTILAATGVMLANQQPDCSLQEAFEAAFFPLLGLDPRQFQPVQDQFYREIFPTLQSLTRPIPGVVESVEEALSRGYRLAIATSPLFPLTAIQQRLAWAGLPVEKYPFALVSSYETFHFSKPNPVYFTEMLAKLGWPESPVVMVGNDMVNEIYPGRRAGLAVFYITGEDIALEDDLDLPWSCGSLSDLLRWLDRYSLENLRPNYNLPSAMMASLRSTPAVLDSIRRVLDPSTWLASPVPEEWCPTEIVCHLRDVEVEVNLPRLRKMLREHNPFLPGVDSDPWASERDYIDQDGAMALSSFTAARLELLRLLEGAKPEDWQRPARHAIFGPTDLAELVRIITGHDRLHVRQMQQAQG
jgi:FMN phosphatase YigB (HAD superfamily)